MLRRNNLFIRLYWSLTICKKCYPFQKENISHLLKLNRKRIHKTLDSNYRSIYLLKYIIYRFYNKIVST